MTKFIFMFCMCFSYFLIPLEASAQNCSRGNCIGDRGNPPSNGNVRTPPRSPNVGTTRPPAGGSVRTPPRSPNVGTTRPPAGGNVRTPPRSPNTGTTRPPSNGNANSHRYMPRPVRVSPGFNYDRAMNNHNRYRHFDNWHRPYHVYSGYRHNPYRVNINYHSTRYYTPIDYYLTLIYAHIYWDMWVRVRFERNNGYYSYNGYPYYVHNGYRHRYSPYDTCDYELVDGFYNTSYTNFYGLSCQAAYDRCAAMRDDLNWIERDYRYFCAEKFEDDFSRYSHWDFSRDFYNF